MMCLAEALLRIPDAATADDLIAETFTTGNWKQHLGQSDSALVNASSWALMLTGSVLDIDQGESISRWFGALVKRSGEPVIRQALRAGMKFLGHQFVMGETIDDAIAHAKADEKNGYTISYDILGEGARTDAQARHYTESYLSGIHEIAAASTATKLFDRPGISVKLSALHPRYTETQRDRVFAALLPRLKSILRLGMQCNIAVSLDAEEANRLELELELYRALLEDPEFAGFEGIGFVLQAYQKRAVHVAEALAALAKHLDRRIPIRLVKGAYWDSEIKHAQVMGLPGYPVFTRKEYTDLSYLACAQILLANAANIYPQFATHNALTVATIATLAKEKNLHADTFEFQRLHGMGESLHDQLVGTYRSRIYAPVGIHKDLLAYLIRRLLESGANSSFVHLLMDRATPVDALIVSPIDRTRACNNLPNPAIPLPRDLYGPTRQNPLGIDFGYRNLREPLLQEVVSYLARLENVASATNAVVSLPLRERLSKAASKVSASLTTLLPRPSSAKGEDLPAAPIDIAIEEIPALFAAAKKAFPFWNLTPVAIRTAALRKAADLLEERRAECISLCITEAKKTYADAIAEIREAADFCRYYANEAERILTPQTLPGPTGESNLLTLHGRGVFVCISPWNFPLAIFAGQIAAALVTGNVVIAKPAEQTPRLAALCVKLLHEAGIPPDILQLACGDGETAGSALVAALEVAGVCFTGSTLVAKHIGRALAEKDGPLVPFIAETGGLNAMIVDSSALLEQACDDIIQSAFGSAGQRCSSLRMLFVQEEVAPLLKDLLVGAMDELRVASPHELSTDIGPVIDRAAQANLRAHIDAMARIARWSHTIPAPNDDTFVAPHLFGLDSPDVLKEEIFGPILHVFTYKSPQLKDVLQQISSSGYGLTFGLHTRLRSKMNDILAAIPAGNRYVNRTMTGAVVGVQPFGGEGLSGTGPKAGGPHYLLRFVTERTTTINTTAIGGNVELLQ